LQIPRCNMYHFSRGTDRGRYDQNKSHDPEEQLEAQFTQVGLDDESNYRQSCTTDSPRNHDHDDNTVREEDELSQKDRYTSTTYSGPSQGLGALPMVGQNLQRSGYSMTSDERIPCPSCSQNFSRQADFERHYRTIHSNQGERPWKCTVVACSADVLSWASQNGLKKHRKEWHGPYGCSFQGCSRNVPNGFGTEADREQHHKTQHPNKSVIEQPMSSAGLTEPANSEQYSNRTSSRGRRTSTTMTQNYPSKWTKWEWDDDNQHWWRQREISRGMNLIFLSNYK
jgi:uncharacterized Zn-finger protein